MKSGSLLILLGIVVLIVGVGISVFMNKDAELAPFEPIPEIPQIPGCTEVGRAESGKSVALNVPAVCLGHFCKIFLLNVEYDSKELSKYTTLPSRLIDFMQYGKYFTSTLSSGINGKLINQFANEKETVILSAGSSSLLNDGSEYDENKFTLRALRGKTGPSRTILYVC